MTVHRSRWIVAAAACLALMACDEGREAAVVDASTNAEAPVADTMAEPGNGEESIIRDDVLAETDAAPEPADAKPATATLAYAEAGDPLGDSDKAALDALLAEPVVGRGGCVIIRGHTDARGSDELNLRLSERRAGLVGDYLVEQGVARERLRLVAIGERRPVALSAHPDGRDYPEGRAKNRRVTVEVLPPGEEDAACGAVEGATD